MLMTKKSFILIGILCIFFIIGLSIWNSKKGDDRKLWVESIPIHTSLGWGYNILVDHKIYIHQEYIPTVMGEKAFICKEDAMKTAALAIEKLKKGKLPTITKNDLAELKISY
jgi:hypothetical protein